MNSSFNQINHQTFHSLFPTNHPLQAIKDEKHYRERALPRIYELVKTSVIEELQKCSCVFYHRHLEWTERFIHLVNVFNHFELIFLILVSMLMEFPNAGNKLILFYHTNIFLVSMSINITATANSMLEKWKIDPEKVHAFLRDGAAAMKKVF